MLKQLEHSQRWTAQEANAVDDLSAIMSARYEGAALPATETIKSIGQILNRYGKRLRDFRAERIGTQIFGEELIIRSQPYDGTGLYLWGFSCDLKGENNGKFMICLNTAHRAGAVAITLAHEFGHYLLGRLDRFESFFARAPAMSALSALGLSEHLQNKKELLCDSVASLLAFPGGSIARCRARLDYPAPCVQDVCDAIEKIRPEYRMSVESDQVPFEWRIRYLTAKLHLFKLRRALAEATGF